MHTQMHRNRHQRVWTVGNLLDSYPDFGNDILTQHCNQMANIFPGIINGITIVLCYVPPPLAFLKIYISRFSE